MIDEIKQWIDCESDLSHDDAAFVPWLRWCVAEIERLRAEHVDDQEALFHYRDMCRASGDQRCETCRHWSNGLRGEMICVDGGPSWILEMAVRVRNDGGAGCDNYKRREQ